MPPADCPADADASDGTLETVVITGAAGHIGRDVTPLLRRDGRALRLLDIALPEPAARDARDQWVATSITDRAALAEAFAGATAVVHLAGHAAEMPWADILAVNIDGTQAVLEAAQRTGVRRVLLASSYHVVGYERPAALRTPGVLAPRPDTYYGVGKAALEALGSVFADRYGMSILSARIVTYGAEPHGERGLAQWLSTGDFVRLIEAVVALDEPGHHVVWAVSDNAPGWFPLDAGRAIGFEPVDDAVTALRSHQPTDPAAAPSPLGELDADEILGYRFVEQPWELGKPRLDLRPAMISEGDEMSGASTRGGSA